MSGRTPTTQAPIVPPDRPPHRARRRRHPIAPAAAGQRVDRFLADMAPICPAPASRADRGGPPHAGRARHPRAGRAGPGRRGLHAASRRLVAAAPQAEAIAFTILYEDADLIVLDKPAGLVVHPAPGNQDGTLVNALLAHCGDSLPGIGGERRPGIVHRLDKDTSGVMVVAKTEPALATLSAAFAARDLDRAYLALVWGVPAPADRRRSRARSAATRATASAWPCCRPEPAAKPPSPATGSWARAGLPLGLLECRLATGRTHQIRVHLAGDRPPAGRRSGLSAPHPGCREGPAGRPTAARAGFSPPGAARRAARLRAPAHRRAAARSPPRRPRTWRCCSASSGCLPIRTSRVRYLDRSRPVE